jgi:arylsulfatase
MTKADRPNILLVTTDQQRFDTIGSRAPAFLRTPQLQQLAREVTSFTCAYSDNPLCVPSRASIMCGQSGLDARHGHQRHDLGRAGPARYVARSAA